MIVAGLILLVVGAVVTIAMIVDAFANPAASLAENIGVMFFFGNIPLIAGAVLVRIGRVRRRRKLIESSERLLLAIARQNKGKLTATLVAMETPLSIDEAREILEMFVKRGVVELVVDENGVVIYHFRELMIHMN